MEWKLTLQLKPSWSTLGSKTPWMNRMSVKGWRFLQFGWRRLTCTFQWWSDDNA
jgi:hypothetical protein